VAGLVASTNLARTDLRQDSYYLCGLGPGAAPAIAAHEARSRQTFCKHVAAPQVEVPRDWREWGLRNWRLRQNLAAAAGETR